MPTLLNFIIKNKLFIFERLNRTIKNILWKELSVQDLYKWLTLLPQLVHFYNNKRHRTIGLKPAEITKKHEKIILNTVYNHIKNTHIPKFKVSDHVRISKYRSVFDKNYRPNWSTEIFTIRKVHLTNPVTYLLEDNEKQEIKGGFYELQLKK